MQPVLTYPSTPTNASRALALDEVEGSVRVRFPLAPKWIYLTNIIAPLFLAAVFAMTVVGIVLILKSMVSRGPNVILPHGLGRTLVLLLAGYASLVVFCLLASGFNFRIYLRWGKLPPTILANADGLIYNRHGIWQMKSKFWPARQIVGVGVEEVRGNLTAKWKTVSKLYLFRSKGRRLRFVLNSRDPELARRIAQQLAAALGCSLVAVR